MYMKYKKARDAHLYTGLAHELFGHVRPAGRNRDQPLRVLSRHLLPAHAQCVQQVPLEVADGDGEHLDGGNRLAVLVLKRLRGFKGLCETDG